MKHHVLVAMGGRTTWLDIEAPTLEAAAAEARRGGGRVLRVEAGIEASAPGRVRFSQTVFLQETLTLLKAGLNVVEVLEALERKERDGGFRTVLGRILQRLREGATFSSALSEQGLFPPVLVAGIAASETAGGLAGTLERYLEYDGRLEQIRRKVSASAIYPLLLLLVGGGVILFLIGYVVPRFATILDGSGRPVSAGTSILLALGQAISGHPWVLAMVLAALGAAVAWLVTQPAGRRVLLRGAMRIPVLAGILVTLNLSRFYRTLALLLNSGIPLFTALGMVRGILDPVRADELTVAMERLRAGLPLSEALMGSSMMPPIADSLLRVGERSGALAEMSDKLAGFLDADLDRQVETFSRLFEPLLMTVIGIVVGAIVVLMYTPIFDLVGNIGS
ncbi:type II secretion system F family protein [Pseudoxanthomonas suwonensis]|uniref:type II secretion system F family protein n=1 Tax=Pseudoxanthomonas suwonensis TaxID=314722 RepID=UPI00138F1F1A|nr:type II secretion system F family protein [Pseudoxanthomonas suwonensis]KAF1703335.1 type II secretion system protein [Pseudoxanthomonas suwonensis]